MLRVIGTTPVMVAFRNKKRAKCTVQVLPLNMAAGNTGLVYGKWGSAPVANIASNTWDFVLNSGAADGTNLYENRDKALIESDLWLVADTADQQVNVEEISMQSEPVTP